jgi:N-acyl-phosphatidylethanolamine-hydrolysing phospholipase D
MDWWDTRSYGDFDVACTPAMHFSGRRPWGRNRSLWCGWTIEAAGYRIFFAGDTGLHPEFAEISRRLGPFDLAILPIGAYEPRWFMKPIHMNPEDAVSAFSKLLSRDDDRCVFLASHWGTFRLTDEPLAEPPSRIRKVWATTGLPYDRLWILAPGESRVLDRSRYT